MSERNTSFLTSQSSNEYPNLKNILFEAGFLFGINTADNHILIQEQALVVRDLEKYFTTNNENVPIFIMELKKLCSETNLFRKSLLHTILKKSSIEIQQESLFRLLLRVDCLQKEITTILLAEITSTASEDREDAAWLRLLLAPLRYLPYIKDAQELSGNFIDILEIATFSTQLEILDSIPEIIPDSQYNLVAKELSKLLDDNEELCAPIIDCLNALNLENEIRLQVRDTILSKICSGSSLKNFPILLEFLISNLKQQNLGETILKIRNALDSFFLIDNKTKEQESCLIVIFSRLQTFSTTSISIVEAFLNMLSCIKTHSDHKPIDLLILFMLHSSIKLKRKIIEAIFRKRVHLGLFKVAIIEKLFNNYMPQQLMKNYFSSIIEIASNLLQYKDFTLNLFVILFKHNFTEIIQRQEILDCLLIHIGVRNDQINMILSIFNEFLQDLTKIQRHTGTLMGLLEKIDTFDLNSTKQVFEILCTLTCREEMNNFKDEIHMLIRKQLSSSIKLIKSRGIISACIMAKHLAINPMENTKNFDETITISDLMGKTKDAALLLELVNISTNNSPHLQGLYYDQLANMLIITENLDTTFVQWLYETITNNFQDIFITETLPEHQNDLQFHIKYNLNNFDEIETQIFVNLKSNQIILLAPHFRLLRLLHYRQQNGDLSSIDALLGCGIILPDTDLIQDQGVDELKLISDYLYHCANWFREIINGFVTQKNKKLRQRVVQRLNDLIEVENLLKTCMDLIPDHKLPICYFDEKPAHSPILENSKKNTKKKFKSNSTVNDTNASRLTVKKSSTNCEQTICFREIDTDILILLKYPLKCDENDEISTQSSMDSQNTTLNLEQFIFLMKDFVMKLTILTENKIINHHLIVPISLITDCAHILPLIDRHLNKIIKNMDKILETDDLLSEDGKNLIQSFGLIVQTFYLIFNWSGFQQNSTNMELLRKILRCLRSEQTQIHSTNRLIAEFIHRLTNYTKYCLNLSHAVHLVKTMQVLYALTTPSTDIKKEITTTSYKLLNKRWLNFHGKIANNNIAELVNIYLDVASIKILNGIVNTLQQQIMNLKTKEDHLEMLKSIDKQNFHIFYQTICNCVQKRVKYEIQAITNEEHLIVWQNVANIMQGLMNITKIHETKVNLACYLKKSIAILKIFLSHGIPIMEIMLRSKPDDVCQIFRTIQISTRFLHHLCCFSKLTKDGSLCAHVPQFRLTLETLVYRVKAALVANNCSDAFWMGILRNRDLHGEDILSQSTNTTEENVEEVEEQLPSDDDIESDSEIFD